VSDRDRVPVRARELVVRALDALADGDIYFVGTCLEELDAMLRRHDDGWVLLTDCASIPDMSVFEEDDRS
jgi:hypothetical protein